MALSRVNETGVMADDNFTIPLATGNMTATDWLETNGSVTTSQEQTTLLTVLTNATQHIADNLTDTTSDQNFHYDHTLAPFVPDGKDFFQHLSGKDETLFLTLVLLAVFIPILFIAIFTVVCVRKRRLKKARRAERLLRNAQDLAMDDYPPAMYRIQALRA